MKVLILSQSHLCRNPRVVKEATALAANGYVVQIITAVHAKALLREDLALIAGYPAISLYHVSDLSKPGLSSLVDRALNKIGRLLVRYLKIEDSLALGYGSFRYFRLCKTIGADLVICHQELATYVGTRLIAAGCKVAFDLEDWYSEDLLPEARRDRPLRLLQKIEKIALEKGLYCTTTSRAMASALARAYGCKQPAVIYNAFPANFQLTEKKKLFSIPLKLCWFSQTIGPGRGLEEFIRWLADITSGLELHLLGNSNAAYREWLSASLAPQHQFFFHGFVPEQDLPAKIAEFDIGLATELDSPPSRNYTITNKFFQYLQSGLPIIATETAGQCEMFEKFRPGILIPQQPCGQDLEALSRWLKDPAALERARSIAKQAASFYSWENESKKLVNLVDISLKS